MGWAEIFEWLQRDPNYVPAWEALRGYVLRWAHAELQGRGEDVIEEAVANTWARVALAIHTARGAETFGGFVKAQYLAARREVLKSLGQPVRLFGSGPLPERPDEGPTVEEIVVEWPYRWQALQRCLSRLSGRERAAIEFRYFDDRSIESVAGALDVTRVNARQILWQARQRLRECLERAWYAE